MNLNIWQIIFLALLQGITELFPISSLGHTVILPGLFGWGDLERNKSFLPLIVALHLGTSIALVIYFWRDWFQVVRSVVKSVKEGEVQTGTDEWVSFLIIIGCIPAGLLGVFLENPLKLLFASPLIAATFLIVNGSLLFLGERMRLRHHGSRFGGRPQSRRRGPLLLFTGNPHHWSGGPARSATAYRSASLCTVTCDDGHGIGRSRGLFEYQIPPEVF